VSSGLRAVSAASFVRYLPILFQSGQSKGLNARYHFDCTGSKTIQVTAVIAEGAISVAHGLLGKFDLRVRADSKTWFAFLRKDIGLPRALLTLKVKLSGDPRLLRAFARCFPNQQQTRPRSCIRRARLRGYRIRYITP
jgi:hypothetical protein